jgi:hypothetical protein
MRDTLRRIGVSETDFIRECDASFKQGSKFVRLVQGRGRTLLPSFSLPQGYTEANLVTLAAAARGPYAELVSYQPQLCDRGPCPQAGHHPRIRGGRELRSIT